RGSVAHGCVRGPRPRPGRRPPAAPGRARPHAVDASGAWHRPYPCACRAAREDRRMNLFGEAIAWLTDPARLEGSYALPTLLAQHVGYTVVSVLLAAVVAIPAGR